MRLQKQKEMIIKNIVCKIPYLYEMLRASLDKNDIIEIDNLWKSRKNISWFEAFFEWFCGYY